MIRDGLGIQMQWPTAAVAGPGPARGSLTWRLRGNAGRSRTMICPILPQRKQVPLMMKILMKIPLSSMVLFNLLVHKFAVVW